METINQIGRVTERKAGEPTEQDEREPDVSVARMGILRERQQVASWHGERGTQQRLHGATKALPSKFFSVLWYHCSTQTLHHNPCVNSKCNFSVFACF